MTQIPAGYMKKQSWMCKKQHSWGKASQPNSWRQVSTDCKFTDFLPEIRIQGKWTWVLQNAMGWIIVKTWATSLSRHLDCTSRGFGG